MNPADIPASQDEYEAVNAINYDSKREATVKWQQEQEVVRSLLNKATGGASQRILDVPVGTGRFMPIYSEKEHDVVGVDISQAMLRIAQDRADSLDYSVILREGSITAIELPARSVDVTVCVRFLNLVDQAVVRRAIAELVRVTESSIILGFRSYRPSMAGYHWVRRVRDGCLGRHEKLMIHPHALLDKLCLQNSLEIRESHIVHTAARNSSIYRIYWLTIRR